ncbi:MAG: large extracellular alpha-helical protein, partial [Proteobacteria bacterium]|nr:large extracellular alpha-helical protein [Pseudomonadota bacterium]
NLLTRLLGRQKFEKKGANPGGGGGAPSAQLRSLFKFVSYWNPALRPDADGKATIRFPLPDNLTGWRVLAMALTPADRMGLGEGHFTVNQPIELRPALPNQVTAGDKFEARFTVMNRTETTRQLTVTIDAQGPIEPLPPASVTVLAEPYKRYTVGLPVHTMRAGNLTLQARADDGDNQDGTVIHLPIRKRQTLDVGATYGSSTADQITEAIAFPPDMRTDVGHVSLVVTPSVIGGTEGAFSYMRDYPYICWEQKLTKGVMASHFRNLKPYLPASLAWEGSAALPQQTLELAGRFQASNGGMTYYKPQDQYVSPYLSAYTALAFNWLRRTGYSIPEQVEQPLHQYLQNL